MKRLLLTLGLVLFGLSTNAQNVTMAKAFYKKAQIAYENKDYKEAITLLEKTKENLNGETNPDIIFLEAKARYFNDININNAKALFEQFLNMADESDSRIEEVSSILVDFETSDDYHPNGLKKRITGTFEDGRKYIRHLTECYIETKTYKTVTEESDKFLGSIQHYVSGNLIFSENVKDGKIVSQTFYKYHMLNGKLILSKYYENDLSEQFLNPTKEDPYNYEKKIIDDISTFNTEVISKNLNSNCRGKNYSFKYVVPNVDHGFKYFNQEGNVTIHYQTFKPRVRISFGKGKGVLEMISGPNAIEYYEKSSNGMIYGNFTKNVIKTINTYRPGDEYHEIYHFDENGELIKRDKFKRKKYKYSERFNKSDNSWSKI